MTTKSPSRDAALEILNGASSGHYARDVAAAVDMAPNHCAKLLQNLKQEGVIGSAPDGIKGASARVRYFALQHLDTALAAINARKAAKPKRVRHSHAEIVAAAKAKVAAEAERRAAAARPEPVAFFSSMKPGQYVPSDSWASRVYGK